MFCRLEGLTATLMTTCDFPTDTGKAFKVNGVQMPSQWAQLPTKPKFQDISSIIRLQDDVDDDLRLHHGLQEDLPGLTVTTVVLRMLNYFQVPTFRLLRKVFVKLRSFGLLEGENRIDAQVAYSNLRGLRIDVWLTHPPTDWLTDGLTDGALSSWISPRILNGS